MNREDDGPAYREDYGESYRSVSRWMLRASIPLFRAFGIHFKLHWSLPLVAIGFAVWNAGGGAASYVRLAWGLTQAGMLFGLVLLHELGHVTAARLKGRRTPEIILTPLGGRAVIDGAMADPAMEAEVTMAGPGVNLILLALSMLFVATAGRLPNEWWSPFAPSAFVTFAFWANVMLAVFNLFPAFPMDGGRLVRAFLAWRKGERRGTLIACRIGQVFGVLFVVAGIWPRGRGGLILTAIGVSNFVACTEALRGLHVGAAVYEEYVPGVRAGAAPREEKAERAAKQREEMQGRVDDILDKVSRTGIGSLSSAEKKFLKKASKKYRKTRG